MYIVLGSFIVKIAALPIIRTYGLAFGDWVSS